MLRTFPRDFRWGVASSGHQTEGGNTRSDTWFLEHVSPTVFREPSGRACDSYQRWREDLGLVAGMGLDTGAVRYAFAAGVPVLVTEHGLGHRDDSLRAGFLEPALAGLLDVIEDGVPVLGYLHWTLLDNFEWIFGYDVRFGLHEVDRETFTRRAKPSAAVYSAIVRAHGVDGR